MELWNKGDAIIVTIWWKQIVFKMWPHLARIRWDTANCKTTHAVRRLKCSCGSFYVGRIKRRLKGRLAKHKNVICTRNADYSMALHHIQAGQGNLNTLKAIILEVAEKDIRGGDRSQCETFGFCCWKQQTPRPQRWDGPFSSSVKLLFKKVVFYHMGLIIIEVTCLHLMCVCSHWQNMGIG